ncbi:MAG: glycerophosphodiester phosphodiesterase [Bacillus sp. (in: Bacteria)]|nr:glycerophosphodiester phosphodiesterase [Bacillus sp. (in: firmicutes)]
MQLDKTLNIAHRGASSQAPENTMAAFSLGLKQGCDGIELDVQLSKDGDFVIIHDEYLHRTTNGTGKVSETDVSALKQLDAGSWFHEDFKGEKIPTLEELLEFVPSEIFLNLELKYKPSHLPNVEEKLLDILKKRNRLNNVVISSFNHKNLYRLKTLDNNVKIGLLYNSNLINHLKLIDTFSLPCYSLHPDYQMIDDEDITSTLEKGLELFIWTVNKERDYERLIELGVSGIITDCPGKLKTTLDRVSRQKI